MLDSRHKPKPRPYGFTSPQIYHASDSRCTLGDCTIDLAPGDFALERMEGNGGRFIELSIDPLAEDTVSTLAFRHRLRAPFSLHAPFSIGMRARGSHFSLEAVSDEPYTNTRAPIPIASISQSGTTLTIVLSSPCDLQRDERFHVYGLTDTRLNYFNTTVATLSMDRKTITATVADDAAISSLTITAVLDSGYIVEAESSIAAIGGCAIRFGGSSATAAALITRASGAKPRKSGAIGGVDTVTTASTASVIASGGNGQMAITPTSAFEIDVDRGSVSFLDWGVDQSTSPSTVRGFVETVTPGINVIYYPCLRAVVPKSVSRPVAKIVSAVKTGTTIATIVTADPHGLQSGAWIDAVRGIRDQTNFPDTTGIQCTVVDAYTITVNIGPIATATSFGGMISVRNGSIGTVGASVQAVQSISVSGGVVTVVGSANWVTLVVGEYVNLYGVRSSGGNLGLDGAYKLINMNGTSLSLIAVTDAEGNPVRSGTGTTVTPPLPDMGAVNCGGAVIMRSTARLHDLIPRQHNPGVVEIDGQGENRADKAVPVSVLNSPFINTTPNVASSYAHSLTTVATTNATSVKTGAGNILELSATNIGTSMIFIKLFNKASAPTVGTDIPIVIIPVAAGTVAAYEFGHLGKRFNAGIAYAITANAADSDTTAITAGSKLHMTYL